ncbi:choline O-acetyltransferase-like protein [Sarcoptes scabiei]|uniref:Choline O-acetyltransferase-like protein n=1 Tax=Sarcoptes scabiei TaxID=52283 RepID=A0A132AET2_SARSC|nr:choline O-acetyltransferase-like protein [Sarcoptes scabiei]
MQTYRHFFNANRIPGVAKDHLRIVSKKANHSKHFIVAAFNQFNVVQLESNRNLPSIDELQQCFCDCWNRSRENDFSNQIGILTTENRRVWSRLRSKLLQDNQNRSNINLLEDSLFVLCLDDSVRKSIESINGLTAAGSGGSDVNLLAKMSSLLVHGGGSLLHTSNRWFDKFLQIVVSSDGLCGIVVEHSASEGMTVLRFCEEFLQYHRSKMNESNVSLSECDKSEKVVQSPRNTYDLNRNLIGKDDSMRLSYRILKWNLDQMILNQIKEAKQINRQSGSLHIEIHGLRKRFYQSTTYQSRCFCSIVIAINLLQNSPPYCLHLRELFIKKISSRSCGQYPSFIIGRIRMGSFNVWPSD